MNVRPQSPVPPLLGHAPPCPIPTASGPERIAFHKVGLGGSLSPSDARLYSRMKYGDPLATREMAAELVDLLVKSGALANLLGKSSELCVAASAYGEIPTAARMVLEAMLPLLEAHVKKIHLIRFVREGGFGCSDYGRMNLQERRRTMGTRKVFFGAGSKELLAGKPLLVFDDLRSTGLHESALHNLLLAEAAGSRTLFSYWIAFEADLAEAHPAHEEQLNGFAVHSLPGLAQLFNGLPEPPLVNARVVKFVLGAGRAGDEDILAFLKAIPLATARDILLAARSRDGYARHKRFKKGYALLSQYVQSIKL